MGITDTVRALIKVMMMILDGILHLLMFVIERTYGTMVCVATSYIDALLTLATAAAQGLIEGIDTALSDMTGAISDTFDTVMKRHQRAHELRVFDSRCPQH